MECASAHTVQVEGEWFDRSAILSEAVLLLGVMYIREVESESKSKIVLIHICVCRECMCISVKAEPLQSELTGFNRK